MFSIVRGPTGTIVIERSAVSSANWRNILCVDGVTVFRRQTTVSEGRVGVYATRDDSKFCFVDITSSKPEAVADFHAPRSGEVGKVLELKQGLCLFEDKLPWYKTREKEENFVIESITWDDCKLPEALLTWTRWLNNDFYSSPELYPLEIDESVERERMLPKRKPSLLSSNLFGTF